MREVDLELDFCPKCARGNTESIPGTGAPLL